MKKTDYEAIARAIKEHSTAEETRLGFVENITRVPFIKSLCDILKAENPKFDEVKFRELLK